MASLSFMKTSLDKDYAVPEFELDEQTGLFESPIDGIISFRKGRDGMWYLLIGRGTVKNIAGIKFRDIDEAERLADTIKQIAIKEKELVIQ